jgi:hypothetical protein
MSPSVHSDDIRAVAEWLLSEIGIPFVIVGGSAIQIEVPVATKDVGILVSGRNLARIDSALQDRKDAFPLDPATGTIRGTKVSIGGSSIDVDFLSAGPFGGDDFLRYVRGQGSKPYGGTLRARPEVVFYMRLSLDDWRENIPSIERDLLVGVPESTLDSAVAVARRFGRGQRIGDRVEAVRKTRRTLDLR